jgi:integrase/recombinase XerD
MISTGFPSLLQSFFIDRLVRQRRASPHTIAGYRDSFRLLLHFAKERLGKMPSKLMIEDLDTPFLCGFLEHLEGVRKNSARTRNARLAAIHSFFQYVALEEPAHALHCQRILAIPNKRHERRPIEFLNREEIDALLAAPNLSTWIGRRDRTLLLVAVQTGLRVSELTGLNCQDVVLGTGAHVRCLGKGRKQRCTPLRPETATMLDAWLRERHGLPEDPVFPSIRGGKLSRDAIERLVTKYTAMAKQSCLSLIRKNATPHVLRHYAGSRTMPGETILASSNYGLM